MISELKNLLGVGLVLLVGCDLVFSYGPEAVTTDGLVDVFDFDRSDGGVPSSDGSDLADFSDASADGDGSTAASDGPPDTSEVDALCEGCLAGGGQCWSGTGDLVCGKNGERCKSCVPGQEACVQRTCLKLYDQLCEVGAECTSNRCILGRCGCMGGDCSGILICIDGVCSSD